MSKSPVEECGPAIDSIGNGVELSERELDAVVGGITIPWMRADAE